MTDIQKAEIIAMRAQNASYSEIAQRLNIPKNTVKSYCNRHKVRVATDCTQPTYQTGDITKCEQCGAPIEQYSLLRRKRFCSDACRMKWWNQHPNLVNRRSVYDHTCQHCGTLFRAYGNARRKYCSHECYIAKRFGEQDG